MKIIDLSLPIEEGMMTFPDALASCGRDHDSGAAWDRRPRDSQSSLRHTYWYACGWRLVTSFPTARRSMKSLWTCSSDPPPWRTSPGCRPLQESTSPILKKDWAMKSPARLILRTGWSEYFGNMKFYNEYPFLSESAAQWLGGQRRASHRHGHSLSRYPPIRGERPRILPITKFLLGAGVVLVEYLAT